MKIRKSAAHTTDKVEMQMTPMIDIVFQLLTFFLMSFKIATLEGDFNIKMPAQAPSAGPVDIPPIPIRLTADAEGNLAGIQMGGRSLASFEELNERIIAMVGRDTGPDSLASEFEVELDADYNLRYENTVSAISAISGYESNGRIVPLIEKLRFTPPKEP